MRGVVPLPAIFSDLTHPSKPEIEQNQKGFSMENDDYTIHQVLGRIGYLTVIEYRSKILLIDTGSKKDYRRLENFIVHDLKRTMEDIKLVALSHVHPDHSGGSHALKKKHHRPIAGHPELDKWYGGFGGRMQQVADVFFSHFTAMKAGVPVRRFWFRRKIRPDLFLKDRKPLPFFEDWIALYTPGHTTHDISFYHEASKTLYTGDMMVQINSSYHLPYGLALPDLMEASLKKVSSLKIDRLILPHGGVKQIEDIQETIRPLFNELDGAMGFPIALLKPLTLLSPEIKKKGTQTK